MEARRLQEVPLKNFNKGYFHLGERDGLMVESQTPGREVGGSIHTSAVL